MKFEDLSFKEAPKILEKLPGPGSKRLWDVHRVIDNEQRKKNMTFFNT